MPCYLTRTGAFLPGEPVANEDIHKFLGVIPEEERVKRRILAINGIKKRHYALDEEQNATHDVYAMAALAAGDCLKSVEVTYLAAGSTNTPLVGPGIGSLVHSRLAQKGLLEHPLEIGSSSGICTSGAQAFVNACRAVERQEHRAALCIGVEQPSAILKSTALKPEGDPDSPTWFMSVFLRFMLSDGAGAFLLEDRPTSGSFRVDWTFSRSFAHQAPLCMKLESRTLLLSQDVSVLQDHMLPAARQFVRAALERHDERLESYKVVLPHLSSAFFRKHLLTVLEEKVPHWTNLKTAGNTGAASIYIMLDEYLRTHDLEKGDRLLLFVPESGQFNFVLASLTAQ